MSTEVTQRDASSLPPYQRTLCIPPYELEGILNMPADAIGLVIFAHGSGSSRLSPRNTYVADALQAAGLGTLLFDLLTDEEALDRAKVFDIDLLADRLSLVTTWIRKYPQIESLPIGFFGASTGAAAALVAAARRGEDIGAVVSRGGRPDLAGDILESITCPTLLIVGGNDPVVLELNRDALARLRCEKRLDVVPGAGHLFEEPGTLDDVVNHAKQWFADKLSKRKAQ